VERAERELIMRQGVVLPETPRERRERDALEEDLRSLEPAGKPVPLRLRNFVPGADAYLAASRGPLAYMLRLREIEKQTAEHEARLAAARQELEPREWRTVAGAWSFDEVNDLIERHNRWYPVESGLPMDPRTGDFALVNGRSYKLAPLDADWALALFPP
jgi:hypothetical protein